MIDGPNPPHDPRQGWTPATGPDADREVLEGRVIPSRRAPYQAQPPVTGPAQQPDAAVQAQPQGPGGPPQGGPQPPPPQTAPPAVPGPAGPQTPAWQPPAARLGSSEYQPRVPAPGPLFPQTGRPAEPDWGALAEEREAKARRRRLLVVGGGVLAAAAIAGIVATAVVTTNGKGGDTPAAGPTASQQPLPPEPSFSDVTPPPPANPLDYISTAAKDTAPLTADTLFPGRTLTISGRSYTKTQAVVTDSCAAAATRQLAGALAANRCRRMVRATYVQGGVAVTVGVAVFDATAPAAKLRHTSTFLMPLNGGGVKDFCHAVSCWTTSNVVGRYAYFTIAGRKDGGTVTSNETAARQAGTDVSNVAFQRIVQRGSDAAAADRNGG